ncbi:MAG TPA: sulfatase-like hydrolase/transferase [Bryobacteraceae bacterium]|nr:sulfatase-like hydrolase/transferase [Bryobacteraceae bacterium]
MVDSSFPRRLLVVAAVILLPFVGFLVSHRYPVWRLEAVAALASLLLSAALLAWVGRGRALYAVVLLSACVLAAEPLRRTLSPAAEFSRPAVFAGLALVTGVLAAWLRERFFTLVVAFAGGMFVAHCVLMLGRPPLPAVRAAGPPRQSLSHVLFLVLDEHCGPAGLPRDIPACRRAAAAIERTFLRHGFRLYPNAFSNYASTVSSIPSLLNGRLLRRRGEFSNNELPDFYGVTHLDARPFFETYRNQGYRIVVLQDRRISFEHSSAPSEVVEYSSELQSFSRARLPWTEKFAVLVGAYQASDELRASVKGFFPGFRFGARALAPLAVPADWPAWLAGRLEQAAERTLVFAHLLVSHAPYLQKRNGEIRRLGQWWNDQKYQPADPETYRDRYTRYAEQIEYVQSRLDELFSRLARSGMLDQMTVVVAGDHGPRVRLRRPGRYGGSADPEHYDYLASPPLEDLLDRFSALLAIRKPGLAPGRDPRKASLLQIAGEILHGRSSTDETNLVFLFERDGRPRGVPIVDLWKE